MVSANILQFEVLLAPIPGDSPAGADLRADADPTSNYYKLKDARFSARAKERDIDAGTEAADLLPEWRTILELAPKVLAEQSKDLEVAAWLIEALVRRHGIPGLRDGFCLTRQLVETFWDNLYPMPDEDGLATRVAPLTALNGEGVDGTLIQPLRKVPMTDGKDPGPFASWHYEQAKKMTTVTEEAAREWHLNAGTVTMDDIRVSQRATKPKFFIDLVDDLKQCEAEFAALTAALDKACGADSPPSSTIRNTLEMVTQVAKELGAEALAAAQAGAAPAADGGIAGDGAAAAASGGVSGGGVGAIRSREDAFSALLRVAEFFRRSEPHSPVSYTLEELVRRGRMSLPDLLNELIADSSQRRSYYVVAGMKPPDEPQ